MRILINGSTLTLVIVMFKEKPMLTFLMVIKRLKLNLLELIILVQVVFGYMQVVIHFIYHLMVKLVN